MIGGRASCAGSEVLATSRPIHSQDAASQREHRGGQERAGLRKGRQPANGPSSMEPSATEPTSTEPTSTEPSATKECAHTAVLPRRRMLLGLLLTWGPACGHRQEVIVRTVGERASTKQIDADPWALFPPGAVAWSQLAADQLFSSSFGEEANVLLSDHLPVSREVGFDPKSHVQEACTAVYATAGADFVSVLRGAFSLSEIDAAFKEQPFSRHGKTIVQRTFAGSEIYVTEGFALSVATDQTLIYGTEIGVRRVLERIEMGKLERALPDWFEAMLAQPADFACGIDLDAQPVPATVRTRLRFLEGLRAARLVGNFRDPGLNLAGTLTYDRPESATRASEVLEEMGETMDKYAFLFRSLNLDRPLRRLETRPLGKDAQVAIEVEGRAVGVLLARTDQLISEVME